jgi:hypothetical protein
MCHWQKIIGDCEHRCEMGGQLLKCDGYPECGQCDESLEYPEEGAPLPYEDASHACEEHEPKDLE